MGNAGWVPAYDLRAKTVGQPIELLMKAQVVNNTGEDWNKVALSLSSGNPTLGGVMPQLYPWTIHLPRPMQRLIGAQTRTRTLKDGAPAPAYNGAVDMDDREEMDAETTVANTVSFRTTTVEFVIETPFTIPSDGKAHTVGVNTHNIPATYKHYATPKLDKDAFLYARTTGWEDLNLLPGEANVFFEGTYVGTSFLDLDQPRTDFVALAAGFGVKGAHVASASTLAPAMHEAFASGEPRLLQVQVDGTLAQGKA